MKLKISLFLVLTVALAGLPACASTEPAAPEAPKVAPPASSPLSKVSAGMTDVDVRKAMGEPTRSRSYMTGKQFIPWYFGSDTSRTAWTYAGQGEVVFSNNRYSGALKVIRVDYNPAIQ
jgi:outer membrane protein assembly factor BamE (lipoprotein component of BamABCDE complex)